MIAFIKFIHGSCNASIREEESIVNFIEYRPLPAREFENAVIK